MPYKPILTALGVLCLTACAALSPALPPVTISPSLTAQCPPHLPRPLLTWGDLAMDYSELSAEFLDCQARQKRLADAINLKGAP